MSNANDANEADSIIQSLTGQTSQDRRNAQPLPPPVGTRIRKDYGKLNVNTWRYSGLVVASLEDKHFRWVILVKRLNKARRYVWEVITFDDWSYTPYRIIEGEKS